MNDELNKIKFRIKALASKTVENGCSEAEAMSAMAMVGRLLSSYNLTMEEVDVRESACKTIHIPVNRQRRGPIDSTINALAGLFYGRCWFSKSYRLDPETKKYGRVVSYAFYVQEHDVEALQYLFEVINNAIESEAQSFKNTDDYKYAEGAKKSAYVSFQRGMAYRISTRLQDIRRENEATMKAHKSTGTELIVLKGNIIEEEFKKENIRLTKSYGSHRVRDPNAYAAGQAAGNRVNLNRPLGGDKKASGYLA